MLGEGGRWQVRFLAGVLAVMVILAVGLILLSPRRPPEDELGEEETDISKILGEVENTEVTAPGEVEIEGVGSFTFDPGEISTVREDIFQPGFFSLFDVLVHLDERGDLEVEYRFDPDMNTHVIDSIDGQEGWWYQAYYDGGWPEKSVFRPDHYPYKDGTVLRFVRAEATHLERIYETYRREVQRRADNDGKIVVPLVIIQLRDDQLTFEDVEITPHNLRTDFFREGVITAMDVITSLADQGHITYELKWRSSVGSADVVGSYWVERINGDRARGRCGFVYEAGSDAFQFFAGNHVHIPADARVLNSPDYVKWFWICI